jgi:hypothetical protein
MLTIQGFGCPGCGILGEYAVSRYDCYYYGNLYICAPKAKDTELHDVVVGMQKAVDAFLKDVPLYKVPDYPIGQSPIGSSKSGYDGKIGPNTSKLAAWAVTVAAEMHREAGEGDPSAPIIIDMRFIGEEELVHHAAIYVIEITQYLNETTPRIRDLAAAIKAKQAPEVTSVFVEPPPLPVPETIRKELPPRKKFNTGQLILGGTVTAAALGALTAALMRKKGPGEEAPMMLPGMMGAGLRRRRHGDLGQFDEGMSTTKKVAIGAGVLALLLGGAALYAHITYGDWCCAFRQCVVAPGWRAS